MILLSKKARAVVRELIEAFDSPEKLIDTLTKASLIPNNSPCVRWSIFNRFIVALHGTSDARGYRQWQEVKRYVVKGASAFHILVPRFKKIVDEESQEEAQALVGFVSASVFRVEDTEGEPLPECAPKQIPKLKVVADYLGIPIRYAGAVSEKVAGVYSRQRRAGEGQTGSITLYSHDLAVFYHELAHALHHATGEIRNNSDGAAKRDNEIVAEICAATLVNIFEGEEIGRQAISYIKDYGASKTRLLKLLPEIMEVVDLVISVTNETETKGGETCHDLSTSREACEELLLPQKTCGGASGDGR